MQVIIITKPPRGEQHLTVGAFADQAPEAGALPAGVRARLSEAAGRAPFRGREEQVSRTAADGIALSVRGLGAADRFDGHAACRFLGAALKEAREGGYRRTTVVLPDHDAARGAAAALRMLRSAELAGYRFERTSKPGKTELAEIRLLPPAGEERTYRRLRDAAAAMAGAVAAARDLANTPPNEADPAWMAAAARDLARSRGMKARVLGPAQLERLGMGGLLAVGGGSEKTPRMVRLEWGSGKETIAVVGKGVTFDTGGISIKPAQAMDEMKFDKCGACAALGIARGVADLDLPFRFRVYLPLAENMPGGRAYRPGDIVRCYGGKTVEILNTDAEGRMILADALAWAACEKPDTLIDLATLTGACVVALGYHGAGLFSPDDELAGELLGASAASAERLWRLPLWPEFAREMRGRQADLRNLGSRWGGANNAAAFLSHFVGDIPRWAHLDIAGTSWRGADQGEEFGATGYGVALVLTWLMRRAGRL